MTIPCFENWRFTHSQCVDCWVPLHLQLALSEYFVCIFYELHRFTHTFHKVNFRLNINLGNYILITYHQELKFGFVLGSVHLKEQSKELLYLVERLENSCNLTIIGFFLQVSTAVTPPRNTSSLAALEGLKPWSGHGNGSHLSPNPNSVSTSQGYISGWTTCDLTKLLSNSVYQTRVTSILMKQPVSYLTLKVFGIPTQLLQYNSS